MFNIKKPINSLWLRSGQAARGKQKKDLENIIFSISGGIGKNIMATAVVNSIKKQCPNSKIVVASPYSSVWENNPDIEEVVNFVEDSDFFKNHMAGKDAEFFGNDPYLSEDFLYRRNHLMKVWSEMFGIKYNNSSPKLYFTDEEQRQVKSKLPKEKPLFFIQTSGGAPNQEYPISWMRDMPMPLAQKVVNHMTQKGYEVIHIRHENQYALENTTWIPMNTREMMCSLLFADKLLLIDSVAQHAAAALGKKAVVCWVGNKPEIFGYEIHTNLLPKAEGKFRHKIDAYLDPYNITGVLHECPYDTNELFDVEEIIKELEL